MCVCVGGGGGGGYAFLAGQNIKEHKRDLFRLWVQSQNPCYVVLIVFMVCYDNEYHYAPPLVVLWIASQVFMGGWV